jgi:hypothetical protein
MDSAARPPGHFLGQKGPQQLVFRLRPFGHGRCAVGSTSHALGVLVSVAAAAQMLKIARTIAKVSAPASHAEVERF